MAIFFEKKPFIHEAKKMLADAYSKTPPADEIPGLAEKDAKDLEKNTKGEFKGLKIILAFLLVVFIFIMAYFSGQNDKLPAMYNVLLHAGEVSLGGLIGILIGESGK
jgi:hypothetical protein